MLPRAIPDAAKSAAGTHPRPTLSLVAEAPARERTPETTRTSRSPDPWFLAVLLAFPIGCTLFFLPYYALDRAARLRAPLHAWLRPSSRIGLAFGVLALGLFLFMWLYPIRKQLRALKWAGSVAVWLRIHVIVGMALPFIAAVHAGWRFDGLIGLGYLAMVVVCLSGLVGRYLYAHIPRHRNGVELGREEVASERRALLTRIAAATGLSPADVERALALDTRPYAGLDPVRTVARMIRDDWARVRTLRRLRREWSRTVSGRHLGAEATAETLRLARREMALHQQSRVLETTQRLFGYWHVAHRPFAVTALAAVLVHVVVAMVIGGVGLGG